MQHLDNYRGQAFIFCGRLFPFVSELEDISEFDKKTYEILELVERNCTKDYKIDYDNKKCKNFVNNISQDMCAIKFTTTHPEHANDKIKDVII